MLFECWSTVCDIGPTFKQLWVNGSCLLGFVSKVFEVTYNVCYNYILELFEMTYNYTLYEKLIIIRKTMCERSTIFCWSNVYTVGPIIYTTLCERHFYYMERGIQPNLQRQWVY